MTATEKKTLPNYPSPADPVTHPEGYPVMTNSRKIGSLGRCYIYAGDMIHSYYGTGGKFTYLVQWNDLRETKLNMFAVCWNLSEAVRRATAANISDGRTWESLNYHSAPSSFNLFIERN